MASIAHWTRRINTNLLNDPVVAEAFDPQCIEEHCREAGHRWRDSFWSPSVTLLTFLIQVLNPGKTLRVAVAQLITHLAARGCRDLPSADPTSYCQARQRMPGEAFTRVMVMLAQTLRRRVRGTHRWLGRRVWIVDATSASMPDTPALQKAFPQPSGQKPGCGFPVAKILAVFCWATGAIHDVVIDSIRPHDLPLFRKIWSLFSPGDVVLADRAYCAFVDVARLLTRGVHCVLGPDDRLVTWRKPDPWLASCGISRAEFERLPESLTLRMIRITGAPRGFRSRTIVVVTTLIDPAQVPAEDVRALYRDRWMAELNFRSLKIALKMEVLRGQSVDVVKKEIFMHLIAYNLIRLAMWQAARMHGRDLHRLSFTGTMQRLHQVLPLLMFHAGQGLAEGQLRRCFLACIADDEVPDRPNRLEPRRRKRRPKEYSLLNKPRRWYHLREDAGSR
jgi:Transposase DDE domain